MSSVYKVIKQRCRNELVNIQECLVDVPVSSIDLNYTLQGLYDYIKASFPDYKVKFLESSNQLWLVYRKGCVPSKQNLLKDQTKKLLEQFPEVKRVEYIQVGNEYTRKKRPKKK
jgi:urate oxidase